MTTYITQNDKNGKEIYYRLEDGKKTKVSRAEYESNTTVAEQIEQTAADNAEIENGATFAEIEISDELLDDEKPEYTAEPIPERPATIPSEEIKTEADSDIETAALVIVQQIIEATDDTRKLTLKITKNFALILYRNCSICGLMYSKNGAITKISFMGKTPEARKKCKSTRYDFNGLDDITSRRDEILEQVVFVNEWLNAERSA